MNYLEETKSCAEGHVNQHPKHIGLHIAINSLDEVISRADALSEKISGHVSKKESEKEKHINCDPSLSEVLNTGRDSLIMKIDALNGRLEEIEELLF